VQFSSFRLLGYYCSPFAPTMWAVHDYDDPSSAVPGAVGDITVFQQELNSFWGSGQTIWITEAAVDITSGTRADSNCSTSRSNCGPAISSSCPSAVNVNGGLNNRFGSCTDGIPSAQSTGGFSFVGLATASDCGETITQVDWYEVQPAHLTGGGTRGSSPPTLGLTSRPMVLNRSRATAPVPWLVPRCRAAATRRSTPQTGVRSSTAGETRTSAAGRRRRAQLLRAVYVEDRKMTRLVCPALMIVALGLSLAFSRTAYGAVMSLGTLTPLGQHLEFTGLASSGGTLVAAGATSLEAAAGGAIDVFTEPTRGWSSESQAATLTDPAAVHGPFAPSISGTTVIANGAAATGPGFDDVFVEPPGGWSGTVQPAARLVAPSGENLGDGVISGNTIVALARGPQGTASFLYVFVQPRGGWSGTVGPAATLTDSAGLDLYAPPVILGGTVFAGAESGPSLGGNVATTRVDVFREPTGGWSGTVQQSAALVNKTGALSPMAVSGELVTAGLSLFREPAGGWYGSVKPVAALSPSAAHGTPGMGAFSGGVAATSTDWLGSQHQCPCGAQIWLFTEPFGGWSGTVAAAPLIAATTDTGELAVALQGHYLFVTGGNTIQVSHISGRIGHHVGPPNVTFAFANGLANGAPRLSFAIATANDNPPVKSFKLTLPHGITFAKNHVRLTRGVSIAGARDYILSVQHGSLLVRLMRYATVLRVQIRALALTETKSMILDARHSSKRHHRKPIVALRATLHATTTTDDTTRSTINFLTR
jgi:hypothetical protein